MPPNTEEDEDIICPWMDCLLKGESDESSSSEIQNYNKDPRYNEIMDYNSDREPTSDSSSWEDYEVCSDDLKIISKEGAPAVPRTEFQTQIRNVTICRKENSSVSSGTDDRNSDIGDLADFSADEEETHVEQFSGCRIPDERANRLWVEQYNFDLIEGMTLMTYTPPPRKNRRRRYEDKVKYIPEVQESNCRSNEMGLQMEEESPQLEPALQPRTDADEDIPSCRDKKDNYGPHELTGLTGCDTDFPSGEHSEFFDQPVTESVTARAGSDTDFPSGEYSERRGICLLVEFAVPEVTSGPRCHKCSWPLRPVPRTLA